MRRRSSAASARQRGEQRPLTARGPTGVPPAGVRPAGARPVGAAPTGSIGGALALAALAGAAGLADEVVWTRALVPVLGNTTRAAAAVLAAVAGAYGIGAHLGSRSGTSARALAVAGSLLVAGFALALPAICVRHAETFVEASPPALLAGAMGVVSIPAAAMGAVFAAYFRGLPQEPSPRSAGLLVAANAAGAAAGAMGAGTFGVVSLGLRWTGAAAAGVHLLAAAVALRVLDGGPGRARAIETPQSLSKNPGWLRPAPTSPCSVAGRRRIPPPIRLLAAPCAAASRSASGRRRDSCSGSQAPGARGGILAALFAAGFASLGMQLVATRSATVLLEGFTPVYACVVATSLAGLALGASIGGLFERREGRNGALGIALLLAAAGAGVSSSAPDLLRHAPFLVQPRGRGEWIAAHLVVAALLTSPVAVPLGACFPLGFARLPGAAARRAGLAVAALSTGSAAGPPVVGLLLVPLLGVPRTGAAIGALLLLVAWRFGRSSQVPGRLARLLLFAAAVGVLGAAARIPCAAFSAPRLTGAPEISVLAARDDVAFSVAALEDGREGERSLLTDAFRAAGTGEEYRYMRALAHLPARLQGHPRRACVIGLGIGSTAGALALHPSIERLEVVEISSTVVDFAPFFRARNAPLFPGGRLHPAARIALDDGRRHLARSRQDYDVVTLEPLLPTMPAAVHFYTMEFLHLARGRLAPGGILCHWVPLHALSPQDVDRIVATFTRSFPSSGLYVLGSSLILLGGDRIPESAPPLATVDPELARDLASTDLDDPDGPRRLFLCGGGSLLERLRGVADLTDDRPAIELVGHRRSAEVFAYLHENLSRLLEWFEGRPEDPARGFARRFLEAKIQDAAEDLAERGYAVKRGDVDAGSLYGSLLGSDPGSALVRSQRDGYRFRVGLRTGFVALRSEDLEEATERFADAAEARPYRFEPRFFLAASLAGRGRSRAALLQAARAFGLVPAWRELREASAQREPARSLLESAGDLVAQAESLARSADPLPRELGELLLALRGSEDPRRLAAFRALASEPLWREALEEGDLRRVLGWSRVYGVGEEPLW